MIPFQPKFMMILCLGLTSSQWSFADETSEHNDATQKAELKLQVMTVTANKIEENINDVPQAITVLNEFELEAKGIQNIQDVIREIPNMNAGKMGGNRVGFRGLTTSLFTNSNPVIIYIDGVATTSFMGFDASLSNVERIEVLRGPQGTLYGKDAIGAVINIVTKEPKDDWSGSINGELGSNNNRFLSFNSAGAIINDTLSMGINGQIQEDDGWVENTHPGMDKNADAQNSRKFSTYFLYKPTDRLKVKFNLSHETSETGWDSYSATGGTGLSDFNRDDAEDVAYDVDTSENSSMNAQSLHFDYQANNFNVQSTTTHKNLDIDGIYDADNGADPLYSGLTMFGDTETDTLSQELRFSSKNATGFRWIAGLYLDKEEQTLAPYGMEFPGYYDSDNDGIPDTFYQNSRMNAESVTDSTTHAVFGQVVLPIATKTELTLGARVQKIEKEIDLDAYYHAVGTSKGTPFFNYQDKRSWNAFLPKIALSHKLNDQWTTYGSYSEGYMPGGFNFFASSGSTEENSFDPQTSQNFEIGLKGQLDTITLSANLFYMDIEDTHVYKSIGNMYLTDNAKKSHSQGIELEASWFATNNLQLSGAVGFTDAKYDDYDNGYTNLKGQKVADTPSHTVRLSAAYDSPKNWHARIDVYHQGDIYFYNDYSKDMAKRDDYTTVDLRAGYRINDWDIYAYTKNLTDEKYISYFQANSSQTKVSFGDPRTFGIGAHYHF